MKITWLNIFKTIFVIFSILFIIQIILKLLGQSPTELQVLYIGFGAIISYLIGVSYKLGKFVGRMDEFANSTRASLDKLEQGLSEVKLDTAAMKKQSL